MYELPFMHTLEKAARPRVVFGNLKPDHGLGVLRKVSSGIGTTGFPIKKFDEGGLMDIGDVIDNVSPNATNSGSFAVDPSQTSSLTADPETVKGIQNSAFKKDKHFLGLSGKNWLQLGLGALTGAIGGTGMASLPTPANLFNPSIGVMPHMPSGVMSAVPSQAAGIIGATKGAMHKADGGPIQGDQQMQGDPQSQQIFQGAVQALMGQSKDPQAAIQAFIAKYGKEALQELMQHLQQMKSQGQGQDQPQGQPQQAMSKGGILSGPGGGMDDSIDATHSQTGQDVKVSDGEYIVPSDAVAMLGDGSTKAGAQRLDMGIAKLRKMKYGSPRQPKKLKPNSNPIID